MSANITNQVAYLRTSREFPEDIKKLTLQVSKAYIDTSNAVNARTIGIFPVNRSAITGESWFLVGNQRQQGLRQVYAFTGTTDIDIGFKLSSISRIIKMSGTYTDVAGNYYGVIPGTSNQIVGQLVFYVAVVASPTSDVIRFVPGGGTQPAISSGIIVLEWISDK